MVGSGFPGLLELFPCCWDEPDSLVEVALLGSGLICSAKTRRRFSAVPRGTQLTNVNIGLLVLSWTFETSFGITTSVEVILYV